MKREEAITLNRQCEAALIPSGEKISLPGGSQVWIRQSLGGGYTVTTDRGYMVRIASKDADALGLEIEVPKRGGAYAGVEEPAEIEKMVWERLRTCFDPEIPINIVDLGLIYACRVTRLAEGGSRVDLKFTLTAPGCGMGAAIKEDVESKILGVPGVREVEAELVWDPPWDQSMMTPRAKLQLGMV